MRLWLQQELVSWTLESVCNYFASATSNLGCNNSITPMWCRFVGNEWLCNIHWVVLDCYDLGLLQVGLKSFVISVDYRDYMGSSLETLLLVDRFYTWTLIIWSVLWHVDPSKKSVQGTISKVSTAPQCWVTKSAINYPLTALADS